ETSYNTAAFHMVSLNFSSPSYTLTLLPSNRYLPAIVMDSSALLGFSMELAATGLSIPAGFMTNYPDDNHYVGDPLVPNSLLCPTMRIAPISGGLWAAAVSFTAVLVPEPSSVILILLAIAAAGFRVWRRRTVAVG